MQHDHLTLLIEQFIAGSTPAFLSEPLRITRSFTAAESLVLPGDTEFRHPVDMDDYVLRIAGNAVFRGSVSNAVILALGSVTIDGECRNSRIFALDSVTVTHADTSIILCCGPIALGADFAHSSAATAASITGQQASVCSSTLTAGGGIVVHSARSLPDSPPASLAAANRAMCASGAQMQSAYVKRLIRLRKHARGYGAEGDPSYTRLRLLQDEIERRRTAAALLSRQATLPTLQADITVLEQVERGLDIAICSHRCTVEQELESVTFGVRDNDLVIDLARTEEANYRPAYVEP